MQTPSVEDSRDIDQSLFFDKNLERVIFAAIGADIDTLSARDLESITQLHASDFNIESLQGIEQLINLEELDLSVNKIDDLTPLSTLTKISTLNLRENWVADLTALKDLQQLRALHLEYNLIENLAPLLDLKALKEVSVYENPLTSDDLSNQVEKLSQNGVTVILEVPPLEVPETDDSIIDPINPDPMESLASQVLVLASVENGDQYNMYSMRANGDDLKLPFARTIGLGILSDDGLWISYIEGRDIYVVRSDGRVTRQVTGSSSVISRMWIPTTQEIAFVDFGGLNTIDIEERVVSPRVILDTV